MTLLVLNNWALYLMQFFGEASLNFCGHLSSLWVSSLKREKSSLGAIGAYKYISWVYGGDRKICHEGHWTASRGLPRDAEQWSRVTEFSIHTVHPW